MPSCGLGLVALHRTMITTRLASVPFGDGRKRHADYLGGLELAKRIVIRSTSPVCKRMSISATSSMLPVLAARREAEPQGPWSREEHDGVTIAVGSLCRDHGCRRASSSFRRRVRMRTSPPYFVNRETPRAGFNAMQTRHQVDCFNAGVGLSRHHLSMFFGGHLGFVESVSAQKPHS